MTTRLRGADVLRGPHQNKFTGFTEAERLELKLEGLVPECIESLDTQIQRALLHLEQRALPLEKIHLSLGTAGHRRDALL
jgi:hypothetical protein